MGEKVIGFEKITPRNGELRHNEHCSSKSIFLCGFVNLQTKSQSRWFGIMMQGTLNAEKTVKWRVFTKKLHYFAENITRPIEKYIEVEIYCVHNIKRRYGR